MKSLNQIVNELEEIVSKNIDKHKFPEIKGNMIKIGHLLIRNSKQYGYVIVNTKTNKTVETSYSKRAAIAIALSYLKNKNYKEVLYFDSIIEKNSNDSLFYFYNIKNSDQDFKKQSLLNRFEESKNKIEWARQALDDYILGDIR
jgi:hypothetical protein